MSVFFLDAPIFWLCVGIVIMVIVTRENWMLANGSGLGFGSITLGLIALLCGLQYGHTALQFWNWACWIIGALGVLMFLRFFVMWFFRF